MKTSARYVKIVEWSVEDQCYVGSCPGLFYGVVTAMMNKRCFQNCVTSLKRPLNSTSERASPYLHHR